jgi:hypothetical protein
MPSALRDVVVPDFGLPLEAPRIPVTTYEKRCREAYARAECDCSSSTQTALLAREWTIAGACMTAVDKRNRRAAAA